MVKMENLVSSSFYCCFFFLSFTGFVQAQKAGFISIDCGIPQGSNYTDGDTGIFYTSDADFIHTGVNKEIPSDYRFPALKRQFLNVRSFPEGDQNCYTLRPVVKGKKYLVRASFMYGNYDGKEETPVFELYLGVNLWTPIAYVNELRPEWTEIIMTATGNYISVCLVKKTGNPYISALEVRPLDLAMYNATDASQSLVLYNRYDVGSATDQILRYPEDIYDRVWSPIYLDNWAILSTPAKVLNEYITLKPPPAVMNTAVTPANGTDILYFNWTANGPEKQFLVYRHFAELDILKEGDLREFNVCTTGVICLGFYQPVYLVAGIVYTTYPFSGKNEYSCSFVRTRRSTLPPILNAIEIYSVAKMSETPSYSQDGKIIRGQMGFLNATDMISIHLVHPFASLSSCVDAIMDIKAIYKVEKNWMGDPCVPQIYSWEGLNCSYDSPLPPRILYLNLAFSRLEGSIAHSIQNLTAIEYLDLSGNNLTGEVPNFLVTLESLRFLNLSSNQLNGSVPSALLERSKTGSLQLSVANNPNLCTLNSCTTTVSCETSPCNQQKTKKKKKRQQIAAPISVAASVLAVALFVLALIYWVKRGKKRPQAMTPASSAKEAGCSFKLENRRFTVAEIVSMTNNFQRILGRGGFGIVYYGQMADGTQVAVKILSRTSQGSNEFQTEAQLLMRVYHKNLVQFVGYCAEGTNMALVLEYMSQGNLAKVLSESNQTPLNWDQRLRIALDIAQGLEYLHTGCKPPIIHRDVKGTNILLNERLEAKIADFGLSKIFFDDKFTHISTAVKGTHGYLDPEYCISNNLNEKSDVYSFGIVLMELITGQPALIDTSDSQRISIVKWVRPLISRGDINNVVDPRLQGSYDINSAWKVIEIAMSCIPRKCIQRPTMSYVVAELKTCLFKELFQEVEW